MRVLIIEDESIAANRLVDMLRQIDPAIEVMNILDSVESSVQYLRRKPVLDLAFLDIELGDGQSFDIFTKTTIDAPVIFITAYQEHTLKAFKLNSIDYLLKPLKQDELMAALNKYKKLHAERTRMIQPNILSMLEEMNTAGSDLFKSRFFAKSGNRLISIASQDIAYFYTRDRLQFVKTNKNEDYIIDKALDEIETELNSGLFFRVNRQFIVHYRSIDRVHTWFSGKLKVLVQPKAYEEIIVSRLKAGEFKRWLGE